MGYTLGIIGGSGLYELDGLSDCRHHGVATSFGEPSGPVIEGRLGEHRLLFLPRHGSGHRVPPNRLNSRANVLALKQLGADYLLSVSAVGSLREEISPGALALVTQYIDRTRGRPDTFFDGDGVVAHVAFADPVDAHLNAALSRAAQAIKQPLVPTSTYVCIEGPQFSTRAESELYRRWGADLVGMTNLPEARLAREAELPYVSLALVTDYDCWREHSADVSVAAVLETLQQALTRAKKLIPPFCAQLPNPELCEARHALKNAVISDLRLLDATQRQRYAPLLQSYLA